MSGHNAKKKRLGSRRRAVNQNEVDEGNEKPYTDASAAESGSSGKTTEVTEVVENPGGFTAVPLNLPSPDLKESKRKFGSRRKQKGLHAGDVAKVLHNKEDGEETTDDSEVAGTIEVSVEIPTPNSPDLYQESETFVNADFHSHGPNPLCGSSELKESSERSDLGTGEDCSHASSENQREDNTEKYYSQSEEVLSPHKSALSLSETLEENMHPFMISVNPDVAHEPNDTDTLEELSERECEERKYDSELLRHTEDFQALRFQNESPKGDDSWLQINADLTCGGKQKETLPPNEGSLEDEQNEHLDSQVDDRLISVDAVDRINVQPDDSDENHEIMHTFDSVRNPLTGRPTGELKILLQSELSTDLSTTVQGDLELVHTEVIHKAIEGFSDVEKEEILPTTVNVADCQEDDDGPSVEERVFSEVEQINTSPEAKQNLLLPVSDYNHRLSENTVAKTNNNEAIATTTVFSEIETEIQEDSMEHILVDTNPNLTENSSDKINTNIHTVVWDDAPHNFSTDLIMDVMQIDQKHSREESNLNETTDTQAASMGIADTEPVGVYQAEDEDDGKEAQGLASDVQVNLDLPPTQLEQMDFTPAMSRRKLGSSRRKKLKPHDQDTDLSPEPAEEATGNSDDHEPLESTVSLATESDQIQGTAHGDRGYSWSADSYVSADEMEKLPVDDSVAQQSDSSLTSSSVLDKENMNPTLAENQGDQVKDSMQTDTLDEASEYFSTDLTMDGMQMDQTHFTDVLEEFSSLLSGRETHSNRDSELLVDDHFASASTPTSVNVPMTSAIEGSRDLAVTEFDIDNSIVDFAEEHFPLADGKGEVEDVNGSNVLSETNGLEEASTTCTPTSENNQEYFKGEDDVQVEESGGTSMDDWENIQSHTGDLSSLHHSENSPINFDEESRKVSQMHYGSCSIENEISDESMSHFGSKANTDDSVSKDEELYHESKEEDNETEEKDFGTFPQTRQASRRKLGSSRRKKLKPHDQDTDLSPEPAEEATGNSDDHEPLESTVSLATESDQIQGTAHGDRGYSWSADSYVSADEMEKLPVDDSVAQQSDSSLTSSSVIDKENQGDQVKDSMQTDTLDEASEYFSTDLTMDGMQMDQTHFTDVLEEFSSVLSGRETHSNRDSELLVDDHFASASTPISVNVPITSETDRSKELAVTKFDIDSAIVDFTDEHVPLADGKGDFQLEDVNGSNVLSETNGLEEASTTCTPTSGNNQEYFKGEDGVQAEESGGTSMDDWDNIQSHTRDLSSLHHSENSDEESRKVSQMHDPSCSIENEISDESMSHFGSKTNIDVSVSKDEELYHESKEEDNETEEKDFGTFPQTRQVSRRKLGSSRRKKLKPHDQDTDLSQQSVYSVDHEPLESTEPDTEVSDRVEETAHGVTHSDIPEFDASNLLTSPTSNQQSDQGRQELLSLFTATDGKEQEKDSDSFGPDHNLHLQASESQRQPPYKEAFTVPTITTEKSEEENQSEIRHSSDPSTLPEEDKDTVNPPAGTGSLCSVDSYGSVDEEEDKLPVDDFLVLQCDSVLQSVIDDGSKKCETGEETLLFGETVTNMEIEESSIAHDGDLENPRYESGNADANQAVDVDLHPPFVESLDQNITINQEEFGREVGASITIHVSGRDDIVENTAELMERTSAQEENKEQELLGVQENSGDEPTADVPREVQQSAAEGAQSLQQVHLQAQTKQKRRKMGSTRRANFNRQQEEETCNDNGTKRPPADQNDLKWKVEEPNKPLDIVSDNSRQRIPETNPSTAVVQGDVLSLDKVDDVKLSERNSGAVMEEVKPVETALSSLKPEHPTNPEFTSESVDWVTQETQDDQDRLESVTSDRLLESAAKLIVTANLEMVRSELRRGDEENPNDASEKMKENEDLETGHSSLKSVTKRRKMGSTRRSLASRRAGEDSSGKQREDEEATSSQDADSGAPKTEGNESTPQKVIVLETVEQSCTAESYSTPEATAEEDQLGGSRSVSTAHQPDAVAGTAAGGRRRKMGSHRKSHGYQRKRDQVVGPEEDGDPRPGSSSSSLTSERVTSTAEEKSPSLDSISEDGDDKKTQSNTITAKAAEKPEPLDEKTSTREPAAQQPSTKGPGGSNTLSTAEYSSKESLPSKMYNVILIGDSSVGKTSFMKRVQTGTFSLDLPASVGTDSCISSVLVDGKHVALQLWDTAGQERFHSITRQIFHRAQAFLLMYDITSSQSFSDISYWATCIQESATDDVTIVLLGNKSDSATRQVQSQDGEFLAKEYNFEFMECSAATGHNVTQSLETVARALSEKCDTMDEAMKLRQEPQKKKSSGCC